MFLSWYRLAAATDCRLIARTCSFVSRLSFIGQIRMRSTANKNLFTLSLLHCTLEVLRKGTPRKGRGVRRNKDNGSGFSVCGRPQRNGCVTADLKLSESCRPTNELFSLSDAAVCRRGLFVVTAVHLATCNLVQLAVPHCVLHVGIKVVK